VISTPVGRGEGAAVMVATRERKERMGGRWIGCTLLASRTTSLAYRMIHIDVPVKPVWP